MKKVLSVGQCGADHGAISFMLSRNFTVSVDSADSVNEALAAAKEGYDLVLVNRVLDRSGESGLDLIRQMQSDEQLVSVPVILVSNYADAQQEAVDAGAQPGFGKAQLHAPELLEQLTPILSSSESES